MTLPDNILEEMTLHKNTWNLRDDWVVVVAWNVIDVVNIATVNLKLIFH